MTAFVDTSAFLAILNPDDAQAGRARETLGALAEQMRLVTSNYIVVETASLVHRRMGTSALRVLFTRVVPNIDVVWVDEHAHAAAVASVLAADRARPSLVDWTSFEVMRRNRIRTAFTFDRDFGAHGFDVVPEL